MSRRAPNYSGIYAKVSKKVMDYIYSVRLEGSPWDEEESLHFVSFLSFALFGFFIFIFCMISHLIFSLRIFPIFHYFFPFCFLFCLPLFFIYCFIIRFMSSSRPIGKCKWSIDVCSSCGFLHVFAICNYSRFLQRDFQNNFTMKKSFYSASTEIGLLSDILTISILSSPLFQLINMAP